MTPRLLSSSLSVLASGAVLSLACACSSPPAKSGVAESPGVASAPVPFIQYGRVLAIDAVSAAGNSGPGGAVRGAVEGNATQNRNHRDDEVFRVTVRFDDGRESRYEYRQVDNLRVGDRVKDEGGQLYRV